MHTCVYIIASASAFPPRETYDKERWQVVWRLRHLFFWVFFSTTQRCSGLILLAVHSGVTPLRRHRRPYRILGIESRLVACKTRILSTVLSLWPQSTCIGCSQPQFKSMVPNKSSKHCKEWSVGTETGVRPEHGWVLLPPKKQLCQDSDLQYMLKYLISIAFKKMVHLINIILYKIWYLGPKQ